MRRLKAKIHAGKLSACGTCLGEHARPEPVRLSAEVRGFRAHQKADRLRLDSTKTPQTIDSAQDVGGGKISR
jgi:hypothetical protein